MSAQAVEEVLDDEQSDIIWVKHSLHCSEFASLFCSDLRAKVSVLQQGSQHRHTIVTDYSGSGSVVEENEWWRKVCETLDLVDRDEERTFWNT